MNPTENEKIGLGLNLLEALNKMLLTKGKRQLNRIWITLKIEKIIELMDEVLC